jgi:molybdopterin-guanine dinucleotide biosynthesis protein A
MHISVKDSLQRFLDAGGRKIDAWTALHPMALVDFKQAGDAKAFANVNTLSELAALQDPPT